MDLDIVGSGTMTLLMAGVNYTMPMEISTMEIGGTTKPMEKVPLYRPMADSILGSGRMIYSMDLVQRLKWMGQSTKAILLKA